MAIIVDNETRLVVQGLTGREGRFHGLRNRAYGTNLVAGVTPGKGGQDVEGVPVFDTVAEAVDEAGANTSLIFVPARFAVDAIYEAVDAGIQTVICITEHIPAHDMLRAYTYFRGQGTTMIGPNCPGVLSPGTANAGIIPAEIFSESGGDEEEKAAAYVAENVTKPVLAYIAGFSAPPGKTMGHAGAIISGSSGTAQAKKEALEARGIQVGTTPTEVAQLVAERLK